LGGSIHVEVDLLGVGTSSCLSGDRVRGEESPFFIHGELASEITMGEVDSRVLPINIGVVMLQPVVS